MAEVIPSDGPLGARVKNIDLARPLVDADFALILEAIGRHGVLCFPGQHLAPDRQKAFSGRFGSLEVNVAAGAFTAPDHAEVMILSNIVENGRAIGLADAGQGWHSDLSYSETIAFLTVLHAVEVPTRDGRPLGATEFADMAAAYDDLPEDIKARIAGRTATHDFDKFWEMMRARPGSTRAPLSDAQRRQKPPVSHPIVLTHPISGRNVLYCDPGYVVRIDGMEERESDALLDFLFDHQLSPAYRYVHRWTTGDVLMWDNVRAIHNAVADYSAEERRLMRRCQVMADRVFDESWAATAGAPPG